MARITQQSSIHTTGVSYENEPIIRSDAAGEIMQRQPSDGGADGIYITESVEDGPAFLGIGVATPTKPLHAVGSALVKGKATFTLTGSIDPAASTTVPGVGTKFLTEVSVGDEIVVSGETRTVTAIASNTSLTVSVAFSNNANDTSPDCKPAAFTTLISDGTRGFEVDNAGAVAIPSGTITVGSLDIGHGAGGAESCTAVGQDALDASHTGTTGCTAIGSGALGAVDDLGADDNTAVGFEAGDGITAGKQNVAVGKSSLGAAALNDNVAVGYNSLLAFTGSNATAVGSGAADYATSATNLVAVLVTPQ